MKKNKLVSLLTRWEVFLIVLLVLLFRPDPYKNQKVYAKRSVQNV